MQRFMSIKPKIFLYMLGFCVVLLSVLWLFQTVLLDSFYKSIKQNEVREAANSIAKAIEAGEAWQQSVVRRGDLYVELYSPTGGSATVPGNRPQGFFQQLEEAEKQQLYEQARESGGSVFRAESYAEDTQDRAKDGLDEMPQGIPDGLPSMMAPFPAREGRESVLYATLVRQGGEEMLLIVSAEITPVSATVDTLRLQLVYISVFTLLLGVGLAWLISRRVSRPIVELNERAAGLAENQYDVSFNAEGYREIVQLGDTLNHAAGELAKTEALRRELVANVGHDLRTPLTLVAGYTEMMRDIPEERTAENMQVVIDEANRLTGLVSELMDYSKLQSGTGQMKPEHLDLADELRGIAGRFTKLAEAEGMEFVLLPLPKTPVLADPKRIAQVVYNFLANAVVHAGDKKRVELRLAHKNGRAVVEVADTGPGIPAAQLPYIWDRYYKTDAPHRHMGSGLGLSIAKSILEQHPGAKYGVHTGEKEGSVFWFSLPLENGGDM